MKKYIYILLLCLAIVSCANDNNLADSPTIRSVKAINKLNSTLTEAPYGWKMVYFPRTDSLLFANGNKVRSNKKFYFKEKLREESFGGFYFLIKFNKNGTAEIKADFNNQTTENSSLSEFEINQNSYTQLSFVTSNYIHKTINDKFRGASDFLYFGKDSIQNLVFKTSNYVEPAREYIVLEKLKNEQDWTDFAKKSLQNRRFFQEMTNPQIVIRQGSKILYKSDIYIKNNTFGINQRFLEAIVNNRAYVFEFGHTPNQDPNKINSPEKSVFLGSGFVGTENGITFRAGIRFDNDIIFYDFVKVGDKFIAKHKDKYGVETGFVAEIWNDKIVL